MKIQNLTFCEADKMKLTRASSYALHAVAYMATQKHNRPVPSHIVARDRGVPERFLLKVLKPLVSARVLLSVKGPHGGYRLARPAQAISLLEIVEAVDGPIRGHSPLSQEMGNSLLNRKLEAICKEGADTTRRHLAKIRLSDLAAKK
jgi:Rrf2 family protein